MLLEMLAKRKGPKVEVEIETSPEKEEDENTATDLAPKGEMQSAEEDIEAIDPMADETHKDKEQDIALFEEMMGGMKPEQMGDKPKSLRERAIIEMMKQRKQ